MPRDRKNKLSIFLIKQEYTGHNQILKDYQNLESVRLPNNAVFYHRNSHNNAPKWLQYFFKDSLGVVNIFSASSKGILLVPISYENHTRIFGIAFWYGNKMFLSWATEERFGIKTALGVVDPNSLRKIAKKNMSLAPKDTSEQLSKTGSIYDFWLDIEQDLVNSITGNVLSAERVFWKVVTGWDALSVSVEVDISSITSFLTTCYSKYVSWAYKENFWWIDQVQEVKNPVLIEELNTKLVENIKNDSLENTWMAVPEVIEWEKVEGFRYLQEWNPGLFDDINLHEFLSLLTDVQKSQMEVTFLKWFEVFGISTENQEVIHDWSVYQCIYSEIQVSQRTFLLSNGKWYEIQNDFAEEINSYFSNFLSQGCPVALPSCHNENENDYNERVCAENATELICLDRNLIRHGWGNSSIEACDIYTQGKTFIHVKNYGGSSVLSHLFNQGVVSWELFASEYEFREKLNDKLSESFRIPNPNSRPPIAEYRVVFAIISTSSHSLNIPFFSKVSLKNAKRRLEGYGYKVSLLKIPVDN